MNLLAIDTANWDCSVALWKDGKEMDFQEKTGERDQAAFLPSLVKEVMKDHKIDEMIVNIGPGSFTGIRLGIGFAKGLAMGLNIPLKGMNGFMATYASIETIDDILILIDAKRTDIFVQRFIKSIPQDPRSLTREEIEEMLQSSSLPVAGIGFHSFLEGMKYQEIKSPWRGAQKLAHGFFTRPEFISDPFPFYNREADVMVKPSLCV